MPENKLLLELKIPIDRQLLVDLLITAVEGGSNYWCDFLDLKPKPNKYNRVRLIEDKPSAPTGVCLDREIKAEDLLLGIKRLVTAEFPSAMTHFCDVLDGDCDANTADVVLQMTVFGELVYG